MPLTPDIYLDHDRCILCSRCIRASRMADGKSVFGFEGRGIAMRLNIDAEGGLGETQMAAIDKAARVCPVACIVIKHDSYRVPNGSRRYDTAPIGSEIEAKASGGETVTALLAAAKPRLATCALTGCFGCHMSLLDIDERILELIDLVDLDRSPFDDKKAFDGPVDIGLVEGGCSNEYNVLELRDFRQHCRILVSVGACAINGGVPAMRNTIGLRGVPGGSQSQRSHARRRRHDSE